MTTPEIILLITTSGTVISGLFNNWFSAKRGQVTNVQSTVTQLNEKAIEIKSQTNGNHAELNQKIDLLLAENNSLREKNVTLEKSLIALAATAQPVGNRKESIRASDLIQQVTEEHTTKQ